MIKKRNVNDVCYFTKNGHFGKCRIEKVIIIEDAEATIVNYEIHPYGINKPVQIHSDNLYNTFEEARTVLLQILQESYHKQTKMIKKDTEEKFDQWEKDLVTEKQNEEQV
jgi:hypothetical protein